MRRALAGLDIELAGLRDVAGAGCVPKVDESGASLLENAALKARAYFKAFGMPVFSCDSGLYFDGLSGAGQPGLFVRRVGGRELDDDEMLAYYAGLAAQHGGRLRARYRNAICLVLDERREYSSMDESLWTAPFYLVSRPHAKRVAGLPLDALSVDIASGSYYYDLAGPSVETEMEQGFRAFFAHVLACGRQLSPD